MYDLTQEMLLKGIRERIAELVKAEIEISKKNIERKIPEIISAVAINFEQYVSFETRTHEIRITIKLDNCGSTNTQQKPGVFKIKNEKET